MKLLFFDIDGTLLPHRQKFIPDSALCAIKKAKEAGHKIFINTGRTNISLPSIIRELDVDGYICGCGASIYLDGKKVFHNTLPTKRAIEIVEFLRTIHIPSCFEAEHTIYFDPHNKGFSNKEVQHAYAFFADYKTDIEAIFTDDFTFQKFLLHRIPAHLEEQVQDLLGEDLAAITYGNGVLEIIQRGFNKGTAIEWIAKELGVSIEDCYAFGDSANDFDMLHVVKHSVAMGNATDEIKKCCEFVTTDILEDGIANALKHYNLYN
ncbi:MAG: HAD family hydrolase [Lachnospiraceae bacterium]